MDGAETVGPGIAAPDDHHALAVGRDERLVRDRVALAAPVLELEVLHRVVDTAQLAPGHLEIARPAGAAGQDDRVELAPELSDRDVHAHVAIGTEDDPVLL